MHPDRPDDARLARTLTRIERIVICVVLAIVFGLVMARCAPVASTPAAPAAPSTAPSAPVHAPRLPYGEYGDAARLAGALAPLADRQPAVALARARKASSPLAPTLTPGRAGMALGTTATTRKMANDRTTECARGGPQCGALNWNW